MWKVEYTKKFLKELAALPQKTQSRVEAIVFEQLETENPFDLVKLEKMVGYKEKYKVRVGDYRIGLTLKKRLKQLFVNELHIEKKFIKFFHNLI